MFKKVHIIVGLGYGDEGKGSIAASLSEISENPIVIRFNGGHQAGHTVTTSNGYHHVFSHFGSGTLSNTPTYWSKYCTFSPAYMLYELHSLPLTPRLFIDKLCPVTTHYDVLFNRCLELTRGLQRLGSCGVGFGATIQRHTANGIKFQSDDLFSVRTVTEKLKQVKKYYRSKFLREIDFHFGDFDHEAEDKKFLQYVDETHQLMKEGVLSFVDETNIFRDKNWKTYIFEGAQGILLDKNFGNKPYVTQSNTTSKNALEILHRNQSIPFDISVHYVTRCYLTRHGGGPFQELPYGYKLKNTFSETNVDNEFQGSFKKGFLNLALMNYAFHLDYKYSKSCLKNLVITCMDQLPCDNIYYFDQTKILHKHFKDFPLILDGDFKTVKYNYSPVGLSNTSHHL